MSTETDTEDVLDDFCVALHRLVRLAMVAMPNGMSDEEACRRVVERGYAQLDQSRERMMLLDAGIPPSTFL